MKIHIVNSVERRGDLEFMSRGFRLICPQCGNEMFQPVFRRHLDGTLSTDFLEHADCSAKFRIDHNEIVDAKWTPGVWQVV